MGERARFRFKWARLEGTVFNDFTNPQTLDQLLTGIPNRDRRETFRELGLPHDPALLDTNVMMVSIDETLVLIDSGWGDQGSLFEFMSAEGISAADIDLVIITHTDGDHVGGLLDARKRLTFANAEFVMTKPAWERWTSDHYLDQLGEQRGEWVRNAAAAIEAHTRLPEVGEEIIRGVRLVDAPGHREGHAAVEISSDRGEMIHVADAVLHPVFVSHPGWRSPIDSYPDLAARTRQRLVERAAEEDLLVASAHMPFPGLGHIRAKGDAWVWEPFESDSEG